GCSARRHPAPRPRPAGDRRDRGADAEPPGPARRGPRQGPDAEGPRPGGDPAHPAAGEGPQLRGPQGRV
ncbi:MAG: hypothetical protein AVDCRST_MAG41-1459, partial [uncultured Corynebacteriales bacterium]